LYTYFSETMFEPHLNGFDSDRSGEGSSSLLEELDKMAPIQRFDAFPKVCLSAMTFRWVIDETGAVHIHQSITARRGFDCVSGVHHLLAGLGTSSLRRSDNRLISRMILESSFMALQTTLSRLTILLRKTCSLMST
jgi:hypothetical protein